MPRTARAAVGGLCYHVINRGNARGEVFHKPEDYAAFCRLLQEAADRGADAVANLLPYAASFSSGPLGWARWRLKQCMQ